MGDGAAVRRLRSSILLAVFGAVAIAGASASSAGAAYVTASDTSVRTAPGSWEIGTLFAGQGFSIREVQGAWAWGKAGGSFGGCGWALVQSLNSGNASSGGDECGAARELPLGDQNHVAGNGPAEAWKVTCQSATLFGNYRNGGHLDGRETVTAGQTVGWHYTTGDGNSVAVDGPSGTWRFLLRSCVSPPSSPPPPSDPPSSPPAPSPPPSSAPPSNVKASAARAPIAVRGNRLLINFIRPIADAYTRRSGQRVLLAYDPDLPFDELARGSINIQLISRAKRTNDPADYAFYTFARDPICVVTNDDNPLPGLSQSQVGVLFGDPRRVAQWRQVPGHRVNGVIDLGVPNSFSRQFGDIFGLGSGYRLWSGMPTPPDDVARITTRQRSTALSALALTATRTVHPVPIGGVPCTLRNAKSGQYRYSRPFVMVTKGPARGGAASFVRFARSSAVAGYIGRTRVPVS